MRNTFFVVANEAGLKALPGFVKKAKPNCVSSHGQDKAGNRLIGLSYDYDLNNDWSKKWEKRGVICVRDESLFDAALKIVESIVFPGGVEAA